MATTGGALFALGGLHKDKTTKTATTVLTISRSHFASNYATTGGGMHITGTRLFRVDVDVTDFRANSAIEGAAISVQWAENPTKIDIVPMISFPRLRLTQAEINFNAAVFGAGIAVLGSYNASRTPANTTAFELVSGNLFVDNRADEAGGAIYWKHFKPTTQPIATFKGNRAAKFGNDTATGNSCLFASFHVYLCRTCAFGAVQQLHRLPWR